MFNRHRVRRPKVAGNAKGDDQLVDQRLHVHRVAPKARQGAIAAEEVFGGDFHLQLLVGQDHVNDGRVQPGVVDHRIDPVPTLFRGHQREQAGQQRHRRRGDLGGGGREKQSFIYSNFNAFFLIQFCN